MATRLSFHIGVEEDTFDGLSCHSVVILSQISRRVSLRNAKIIDHTFHSQRI